MAEPAEQFCNKGDECSSSGEYEEAVGWFDKAIAKNPHLPDVWLMRGIALLELGRFAEANRFV